MGPVCIETQKLEAIDERDDNVYCVFICIVCQLRQLTLTVSCDLQLPMETTTLLHEPGKLPEQSGFYAPKPFAYSEKSPEENHTKVTIVNTELKECYEKERSLQFQ